MAERVVEPFSFLKAQALHPGETKVKPRPEEKKDEPMAEKRGRNPREPAANEVGIKIEAMEKQMSAKIDGMVPDVAKALQISHLKWAQISSVGSLIYIAVSCIMLFARPDFLNV